MEYRVLLLATAHCSRSSSGRYCGEAQAVAGFWAVVFFFSHAQIGQSLQRKEVPNSKSGLCRALQHQQEVLSTRYLHNVPGASAPRVVQALCLRLTRSLQGTCRANPWYCILDQDRRGREIVLGHALGRTLYKAPGLLSTLPSNLAVTSQSPTRAVSPYPCLSEVSSCLSPVVCPGVCHLVSLVSAPLSHSTPLSPSFTRLSHLTTTFVQPELTPWLTISRRLLL